MQQTNERELVIVTITVDSDLNFGHDDGCEIWRRKRRVG